MFYEAKIYVLLESPFTISKQKGIHQIWKKNLFIESRLKLRSQGGYRKNDIRSKLLKSVVNKHETLNSNMQF